MREEILHRGDQRDCLRLLLVSRVVSIVPSLSISISISISLLVLFCGVIIKHFYIIQRNEPRAKYMYNISYPRAPRPRVRSVRLRALSVCWSFVHVESENRHEQTRETVW